MLGPDSDLVRSGAHHLPVFPTLFMGNQSSLDEYIVEEDVHDDVVASIDFSNFSATTRNVLGNQRQPRLAAPALCLSLFLCDELSPLSNAEDVLLDLPYDFHRLRGTVQPPSSLLED